MKPIAETPNFIVLDKYDRIVSDSDSYQSEDALERELIRDLQVQGYEFVEIRNQEEMLRNVRVQLQALNDTEFTDEEWTRFVEGYLDPKNENSTDKARKLHEDYIHDFVFDDGHIENVYLVDKKKIHRNKLQVIKQFEQTGTNSNRYDVTILVNGLPLVQIELKKRGVAIREAFNQVHRYSKESFNSDNSLYKFLQLFIISNGTDTRYFANTTKRNKNSYDFTMNWAKSDNALIKDLKDFTATFLQQHTLLEVLLKYSVFSADETLLVMRPYQIAATERILWRIQSSHNANTWSKPESGGYIWHTTGSGKTLTSFKAARLAKDLPFVDKVFFVVDRKDLDYQTMKEYQRFSPDSVNGSSSTAGLKRNIERDDNKIIVTTIQKLNNLMKSEDLAVYGKKVVFIFDECHRSQFGEAQKNLKKKFKKYCQFGFTGTPIFPENALGYETTQTVFGTQLHTYVITDAIRDEKVLKFKVDYNQVSHHAASEELEQDLAKLTSAQMRKAFLHEGRIAEVSRYILDNFPHKTHRAHIGAKGFNAMFAVESVPAAKAYYEEIQRQQQQIEERKRLNVATIFSFAANEAQDAIGDIQDETFDVTAMNSTAKEFLQKAINDYNATFKTNFSVESKGFQNYYRDLAKRVKNQEVDILIVVGMFLTGFDAPTLNTLFVDKNLRYHGLLQAYSRTNRIYDATKTFGNIVTFRDLEKSTTDAIVLFGDTNTRNVVLEKSYKEYMEGFTDIASGKANRGYENIVKELQERFPDPTEIVLEAEKKEFVKLFGEYLRVDNILQNYDEFTNLHALQGLDLEDEGVVFEFKAQHYLTDEDFERMKGINVPSERLVQDYRSTYNDTREWLRQQQRGNEQQETGIDWSDVVFEVDLLHSQEINLDYILEQIFEKNKHTASKDELINDVRRIIRSSIGNRAKEDLVVDFMHQTNLDEIGNKANIIEAFFEFANNELEREAQELIRSEALNPEEGRRYINSSLRRGFASENGTALNATLPKMSPLNPEYRSKKETVFQKFSKFVEKFKGVSKEL